jgi:hypothetical protein
MMEHILAPEAVFASMMIGWLIDYFSVGPDGWRDKIAFLFYLAAFREGFNGGAADEWLLKGLGQIVDLTKKAGNTYLASARTNIVVGAVVGAIAIYTVGCIIPDWKAFKKLGPYAKLQFPTGANKKINWKLLFLAIVLGLTADNINGFVGIVTNTLINADCFAVGPILNFLLVEVPS